MGLRLNSEDEVDLSPPRPRRREFINRFSCTKNYFVNFSKDTHYRSSAGKNDHALVDI